MAVCLYQMFLFTLGMCRIDRAKQGRIVVFYQMFQEFAAVYCILYVLLGGVKETLFLP